MARRLTVYTPFSVPLVLLAPVWTESYGVRKKTYQEPKDGSPFNGSFRTFGGTDREVNGVYTVENTATIDTWYRPDIKSDCRVYVPQSGATYEIYGDPENIDMRNQYLRIRVREIKGGA